MSETHTLHIQGASHAKEVEKVMNTIELVRRISYWTKEYQFCGKVTSSRTDDHYMVEFEARTTKTRASSMVTRIKLIAA